MPFCPNPECPFRKRHGESAEYIQSATVCSNCGTALVADDLLGAVVKKKREFKIRDVHKRILWTLGLLVFYSFARHFPLPGIHAEELWHVTNGFRLSLFSLGLMPYIAACVLVEIVALFLQPLKRWRSEDGEQGRARLRRAALFLTVVIGILYGRMLVWKLGNIGGGRFLVDNGPAFKSLLVLTLVAAVFFVIWIADLISAMGCGHGISLIILFDMIGTIPHSAMKAVLFYRKSLFSAPFVLPLLALAAAIVLIIYMERSARKVPIRYADGMETSFPVKLTTAGTQPVEWAYLLLAILLVFVPSQASINAATHPVLAWIAGHLYPGASARTAVYAILTIILYFVFTALFFNHREMISYLRKRNASLVPNETDGRRSLKRGLNGMALIGGLYLVIVFVLFEVVWWLLNTAITPVEGISLIVVVCITLDLIGELLFRWQSDGLVRIAEFHEPWKAGLLRSLLEKESVPSLARGYYHRSLLYLFGPYIEMPVFVAAKNEITALKVMKKYLQES